MKSVLYLESISIVNRLMHTLLVHTYFYILSVAGGDLS